MRATSTMGRVVAVCRRDDHTFSKQSVDTIRLLAGLGVEGDAHAGATVRHRSRVAADPSQPNLRQVHLLHAELFDEPAVANFDLWPGAIGENVLTRGIPLLDLPRGALLRLGTAAVVEVTGLRNPCAQLDGFKPGLLAAMLGRDAERRLIRKAGVMGVARAGGLIRPGDAIEVMLPSEPHRRLERV